MNPKSSRHLSILIFVDLILLAALVVIMAAWPQALLPAAVAAILLHVCALSTLLYFLYGRI